MPILNFQAILKNHNFVNQNLQSYALRTTRFIGKRFIRIYKGSFSRPVIRIATAGISLSIAVMIISVVIVKGFQLEIRNKVIGFSGHVRVKPFQMSSVDQQIPLLFDREDVASLKNKIDGIISVQPSAEKAGIIKTDDQIEGCIFKGITSDYYTGFMNRSMIEGRFPQFSPDSVSNEVAISAITASRMGFKIGDYLRMFFLLEGEKQPRGRKFTITGIFHTGLSEFDIKYMFGDLRHLQHLNRWGKNEAGILEIIIDNYDNIEYAAQSVRQVLEYDLEVWNVRELYPEIFNWLNLLDLNVAVIITIMLIVAMINIITILLIRILEKTSAIGILKALGATNRKIREIFLYISIAVMFRGMLIGNAIGLLLAFLQSHFSLIQLDQDTYYVSTVPIYFDWSHILLINSMVFVCGIFFMVIPSMIISRIYPAQTLRLK